jgi:hypothetical protein
LHKPLLQVEQLEPLPQLILPFPPLPNQEFGEVSLLSFGSYNHFVGIAHANYFTNEMLADALLASSTKKSPQSQATAGDALAKAIVSKPKVAMPLVSSCLLVLQKCRLTILRAVSGGTRSRFAAYQARQLEERYFKKVPLLHRDIHVLRTNLTLVPCAARATRSRPRGITGDDLSLDSVACFV